MPRQLNLLSQLNPATMKGYGDCDPPEGCEDDAPECVECGEPMEVDGPEAHCPACGHCEEPDYESMSGADSYWREMAWDLARDR